MILFLFLLCELNAFYLKYLLWIPPAHPINIYRLFVFFLFTLPAIREVYQYLSDPRCKRIGMRAATDPVLDREMADLQRCEKVGKV